MDLELAKLLAVILGPGGAVYLGLKGALNGMRADVRETKELTKEIRDYTRDTNAAVARLEAERS